MVYFDAQPVGSTCVPCVAVDVASKAGVVKLVSRAATAFPV